MHEILRQKNFRVIECNNGDKAVDIFISEDPELVIISLDIPGLDGHISALEMRESRNQTRIVFTSPRSKMKLSRDAAFSAGAVALLEKPVSQSSFEDVWELINGEIPEAPGLEDLDELYPDVDDSEEELTDIELDDLPPPPPPSALPALGPPPKRRKKGRGLLFVAILLFVSAAGAIGFGLSELGYLSF